MGGAGAGASLRISRDFSGFLGGLSDPSLVSGSDSSG